MVLTITEPAHGFVYQRNKLRRYEAITLAGTWSGTTPVGVEYRLNSGGGPITSWHKVASPTIADGVISFETGVVNQRKAFYQIDIRTIDSSGSVIDTQVGVNSWGVGARVWLGGQSNIQLWSGTSVPALPGLDYQPLAARAVDGSRVVYSAGLAWSVADVGPGEKKLSDDLANELGCVIGIYNGAVGGAALNKAHDLFLGSFIWHQPHTPLVPPGSSLPAAMLLLAETGGVEIGIWNLGETEAVQPTRTSKSVKKSSHKAGLLRLFNMLRALSGVHFPVFILPMGSGNQPAVRALGIVHSDIREITGLNFEDDVFVAGGGAYAIEHGGNQSVGAWTLDSGNIWVATGTVASPGPDLMILDSTEGVLMGSKVAMLDNGDWFWDNGTGEVFLYSDGGTNPEDRWTNRGVFAVIRNKDTYHLTAAGYVAMAQQAVDSITNYFRGKSPNWSVGPTIEKVRYGNAGKTVVDLYVGHDGDGSSLVAVGGALRTNLFRVEDDGVLVAVSSATIVGTSLIRLVLGAAITGDGTFAHAWGTGYDGVTYNGFVPTPVASPTSGPCQDNNGRYLRPLPDLTKIESYKGRSA